MTREVEPVLRCTTCRNPVPRGARHRPFCSARCKMVDLGRWFNEDYVVPGEDAVALDPLEGLGEAQVGGGAADEDDR